MKQDEILEGNKLIAEFMGAKEGNPKGVKNKVYVDIPIWHDQKMQKWTMTAKDLKYHSSWDWLMPACKKWDTLYDAFEAATDIYNDYDELCNSLDAVVTFYEIEPVFEQLVRNIKWYNKNKK